MGEPSERRDRISDLQDDILHHILSFLPLKDVLLTSVLAKRWRDTWTCVPTLDLDDSWFRNQRRSSIAFRNFVDNLLRLRDNTAGIRTLRLCLSESYDAGLLYAWIKQALDRGAQELDISISHSQPFELQCRESVRVLRVSLNFNPLILPPPSSSHSFRSLVSLDIDMATLSMGMNLFGEAISSRFPSLRVLHLLSCTGHGNFTIISQSLEELEVSVFGLKSLEVSAPKLETFIISGSNPNEEETWFKISAPQLRTFRWSGRIPTHCRLENLTSLYTTSIHWINPSQLVKPVMEFLCGLAHTEYLSLTSTTIEGISIPTVLGHMKNLSIPLFPKLRSLKIYTRNIRYNLLSICCLLENAPNLVYLYVSNGPQINKIHSGDVGPYLHALLSHQPSPNMLKSLKKVELIDFGVSEYELEFMKVLSKSASCLEDFVMFRPREHQERIRKLWLKCPSASSNVHLQFF